MDKEQLERSAEMFEMILQTAPDTVQNYLTLKDIYRQLKRDTDFKRVAKGLAQLYLDTSQSERAAGEYAEVLEIDPKDEEALGKLQEIGYGQADLAALKAQVELQEIRTKCEQKKRELEGAEAAFLKASARARDARRGEDEETHSVLQAVEEKTQKEMQQLIAERERWQNDGRTEVFNQVAESLKEKADRIIQGDEFKDIRKSVKKAEKLLASTDKVFEQEWRRLSEQREKEFHEKIEELKQANETQLRSAWQEVVARAERDQAAADLALRKVKEELRKIQTELKEKEKLVHKSIKDHPEQPSPPQFEKSAAPPEVVVVAPQGLETPAESREETVPERPTARADYDEVGKALGAILVQHGLVSREHLEEAIAKQAKDHRPVGQILVDSGHASEEDIINALVAQAGVPYLPLANYEISDEVAMIIPREVALRYVLMPVDKIGNSLLVAMGFPLNKEQKREVQRQVSMGTPLNQEQKEEVRRHVGGMKISYFISSWSEIKAKHERHYV